MDDGLKEVEFEIDNSGIYQLICGNQNSNLNYIKNFIPVSIGSRGNKFYLTGKDKSVNLAYQTITGLVKLAEKGSKIKESDIKNVINILIKDNKANVDDILSELIIVSEKNKKISPKSINQKEYVSKIKNFDVVFGIGPAGTGKTFLAVAMAIKELKDGRVDRIILTRPAVEAGEKLGFLPGDLVEKVNPYLRPLHDALFEMLGAEKITNYLEKKIIEVAPLAFMRGRTLDNSFVILDEAQNTTKEQMKMFLTRLGKNSKAVITGDITQIDLPGRVDSGLLQVLKILKDIKGIEFAYFEKSDIVRHSIVQKIIEAYENYELKGNQ